MFEVVMQIAAIIIIIVMIVSFALNAVAMKKIAKKQHTIERLTKRMFELQEENASITYTIKNMQSAINEMEQRYSGNITSMMDIIKRLEQRIDINEKIIQNAIPASRKIISLQGGQS